MSFRALLIAACVAACADFSRGDPAAPGDVTGDGAGAVLSFATEVHPILMTRCQTCHRPAGVAGSTDLVLTGAADADLDAVLALISEENPDSSPILQKGSGHSHGGGTPLPQGSADYDIVREWIAAGAAP
jgi:hypothetical protein